jgi:patatin-like phospholipase/acyl hydrolase
MRILSFDGGGVLGIGPASFLEERERDTGKSIYNSFNGFSGTSTGSIIAAGLAIGLSAHHIVDLYNEHCKNIFKKRPWWKRGLTGPTYDSRNLKRAMKTVFGDIRFKDIPKTLLIPSSDFHGKDKKMGTTNFYSANTTPNMKVYEAVVRSCSAPTYFSPVSDRWVDGGLFANNPSMAMITHLIRNGIKREKIRLISFATGGMRYQPLDPNPMNPVKLAKNIIDFMMASSSARVVHKYCKHSGIAFYERIGPDLIGPKLDSLDSMPEWRDFWIGYYKSIDSEKLFQMQ